MIGGVVGRAVVDHHELPVRPGLVHDGRDGGLERTATVARREHDADDRFAAHRRLFDHHAAEHHLPECLQFAETAFGFAHPHLGGVGAQCQCGEGVVHPIEAQLTADGTLHSLQHGAERTAHVLSGEEHRQIA